MSKLEFIRTDVQTPQNVPEFVYTVFHKKYPEALQSLQRQSIETIERLTKSISIPGNVKTDLIGALNSFYMSGYWHSVQSEAEAAGRPFPKDLS